MAPEPGGGLTVPEGEDAIEFLARLGLSDGLPLVPPTPERVRWMLSGTSRSPDELIGKVPPAYSAASVRQVAANAVMAGCGPEQLPLVLAGCAGMLEQRFNLHGVHATTMGACIGTVVNGPARLSGQINSGLAALGSGHRGNASVGRALRLVLQNLGGAKPGGTESSTIGSPNKFTWCLAENEAALGSWAPLADGSSVTVQALASGAEQLIDFSARGADELVDKLAAKAAVCYSQELCFINELLLVVSPEHAKTLQRGGIRSKRQLQLALARATNAHYANGVYDGVRGYLAMKGRPAVLCVLLASLVQALWRLLNLLAPPRLNRGQRLVQAGLLAGLLWLLGARHPLKLASALLLVQLSQLVGPVAGLIQGKLLPKFSSPDSFHIVVAGAEAGKFSQLYPGFGLGKPGMATCNLSQAVSVKVEPLPPTVETRPPAAVWSSQLVDPRRASTQQLIRRCPRRRSALLDGCVIGLVDISKPGGSHVLDRIESRLGVSPRTGRAECVGRPGTQGCASLGTASPRSAGRVRTSFGQGSQPSASWWWPGWPTEAHAPPASRTTAASSSKLGSRPWRSSPARSGPRPSTRQSSSGRPRWTGAAWRRLAVSWPAECSWSTRSRTRPCKSCSTRPMPC